MSDKQTRFAAEGEAAKPEARQVLFTDYAIDKFIELLMKVPDPDTVLERAGKSRAHLRALESDDEISAALETRLASVLSTPWRLEPGEGPDFEAIHPQLKYHIDTIITGAWQAVPYGYSVQEVTYRQARGRIEWDSIREKPFEWFMPRRWTTKPIDAEARARILGMGLPIPDCALIYFPASGTFISAHTGSGEHVHLLRPGKFFCTRRRPSDDRNPYGEALLTRVYWPWFFRDKGWKFWARFLERFGSPLLIGKTPDNTSDMVSALAAAVQSAVLAVGKEDDVTAISPSNAGDSFQRFSAAVDKRIQKVILGQTLTTDIDGKGSYAAAQVHDMVRQDRRIADVHLVERTVQAMIDTLLALNGRPHGAVRFVMEDEVGLQPERAERDAKLVQAGILKLTPEYLLRAYDFEEGDFELPETGQQQEMTAAQGAKASLLLSVAERAKFTPAQRAIEALADAAIEQAGQPISTEKIRAAIKAAKSPEDLAERIAELYDGKTPGEFESVLERALFAADVMGYAHQEVQS